MSLFTANPFLWFKSLFEPLPPIEVDVEKVTVEVTLTDRTKLTRRFTGHARYSDFLDDAWVHTAFEKATSFIDDSAPFGGDIPGEMVPRHEVYRYRIVERASHKILVPRQDS